MPKDTDTNKSGVDKTTVGSIVPLDLRVAMNWPSPFGHSGPTRKEFDKLVLEVSNIKAALKELLELLRE